MTSSRFVMLGLTVAWACTANADKVAPPAAQGAEARAQAVLNAQLAAMPDNGDAFAATFAPGAVILHPAGADTVQDNAKRLAQVISFMHPHADLKSKTADKLVAGGNDSVVWFSAELAFTVRSSEEGSTPETLTYRVRALEVLDAAANWKVVAAAFSYVAPLRASKSSTGEIPSSSPAGPLAALLAAPDALSSTLDDKAVVLGTDPGERAIGKSAAKALLAKWQKLPFSIEQADKVREVHTAAYGFAMGDVNLANPKQGKPPLRLSAMVVALPAANGQWSVVAASYGTL